MEGPPRMGSGGKGNGEGLIGMKVKKRADNLPGVRALAHQYDTGFQGARGSVGSMNLGIVYVGKTAC